VFKPPIKDFKEIGEIDMIGFVMRLSL
jgi:hypothetical protein